MPFIEAPTTFYLGKRFDLTSHRLADEIVYYDSRDLTTHAVVVGMTGSGKTGLCISLLEEAILDNIPAIIIDPKGDITNLLLTFPDLLPTDFQPWVNVDDARRAGMDVHAFAADTANRWREGLQSWGIVPDRLKWLKLAAKTSIYTPGSDAGLPISILASLRAPREGWVGNEEGNRERINGTVTALLALIGLNVEAVKDREHVLVANIFEYAWRQGRDLTLEDIILQVQQPPFDKLGVVPVDDYFSEKERYKLAMSLNSIVAAPSFQSWIQGEPLDIQNLLYQPNGRPRVSIFYIAHLSEPERQFIITLITENMLSWMRGLSGTTSLRALFYIDEMFGYFPPHPYNPPTKEPILRLLKQARAFGLGMILATQNPGDLDYKGLSNAGSWFIGRLQSANDQKRVMSGLESLATAENGLDMQAVGRLIADIEPRVFLMHNVHDTGGPAAGPYPLGHELSARAADPAAGGHPDGRSAPRTDAERRLLSPGRHDRPGCGPHRRGQHAVSTRAAHIARPDSGPAADRSRFQQPGRARRAPPTTPTSTTQSSGSGGFTQTAPPVPSGIAQYFVPPTLNSQQALAQWQQRTNFAARSVSNPALAYQPGLLAQAAVRYQDRKTEVFTALYYAYFIPDLDKTGLVHWDQYSIPALDTRNLSADPLPGSVFGDLSAGLTDSKRQTSLKRELVDALYNTARLRIPHNPTLKLFGDPKAAPNEFLAQAAQAAREQRDQEIDKVTAQFEAQMDKLDDKRTRKERELSAERKELADRRREQMYTTGEAVLSLLRGRTTYTLSRTSRSRRYSRQTEEDLIESQEVIQDIDKEMDQLQDQLQTQLREINDKWAQIANDSQEYIVTPYKKDIQVELFGVGWMPHWYAVVDGQALLLPAYVSQ